MAKRIVLFYGHPGSGPVYFQKADLQKLPPLFEIAPLTVKEMDSSDTYEVHQWLEIINESFLRQLSEDDYCSSILSHAIYDVLHTYFLLDKDCYIGVVSLGVFKKNTSIAVTHYLGIRKAYLGRGLGKYLILFVLHKARDYSFASCEGESSLSHFKSIYIHFDLGFKPKEKLDYWNTPNPFPFVARVITRHRFRQLYLTWQEQRGVGQGYS
jgi:GNAT superfamily N-acetyltransferase